MPIIFIKGSCLESPLYTMCWINEDGDKGQVREQGEELGGGGGWYEARRVKGAFSVITCNLTASATHLLVSAVPRIWIAVSKSPFLIGLESYMYCHTISPGSYKSLCKGAARPPNLNLQRDFFAFLASDNAELFWLHFLKRLTSLRWFPCLVFADKSKIV